MKGTLDDLAATGLASVPTLRAWLRELPEDTPWLIRRGSKGDAYEIDIPSAVAAFKAREEAKAQEARERADQIKQLGLDLGLSGADDTSAGLSIAERKQLLEEELVAMKIAAMRGELVPRASVEAALGDVLIRDRQRRSTFAARLAKRVDLSRDQLTAVERLIESDQSEFARMLKDWGKDLGDDSSDADAAAAVENTAV